MKKLSLNKKVVARLNNPENIYGGLPLGCKEVTTKLVLQTDIYCDHNTGGETLCLPSHYWHCPSNELCTAYPKVC